MAHLSLPSFPPRHALQGPLALAELALPAGLRIGVLAPHPDDFDAIAVTLRHFHARGDSIQLAVLTGGASGVEDGFAGAHSDAEKTALRKREQLASCALFGLPSTHVRFLELPADEKGNPRLDAANHDTIRHWLLTHQPQLVFMPHGNDSNVTHQRTYALFRQVVLAEKLSVWAVLNQDAKTIAMRHDLYTGFDADEAAWKSALLRLHDSQHQRNLNTRGHGFDERVLAVNQDSAKNLGLSARYAEVFELEVFPQ
ncbi:MAG: PIG-L family deacetylase [Rhodocyclaceae bacterium]|nr:PIG-L family deacetylase [Rhodocyclaceae bacterium]